MQSKEWQVHLIRNGQDEMGNPTFTYARKSEELGRYRRKSIGDGLMSHVSRIGMAEDLKESGLTIRMALRSLGEGSQKLRLVCRGDDSTQVDHVFCSDHPDEMGVIRFFALNCGQSIPNTIWIKVTELDANILASSIGGELEGSLPKRQTSMDEFSNIEIERTEKWCKEREAEDSASKDETILDFLERDRISASRHFGEFVLPGPLSD